MRSDEIRIEKLEIYAHHGVFAQEQRDGQIFEINAVLYTDLHKAGLNDDLTFSTHYGEVCELIRSCMTEQKFKLIETVAEHVARQILLNYPLIRSLDLEVRKPEAPIPMEFRSVSVKIHRGWNRAYVAVGANMGDEETYISDALNNLKADGNIRVLKESSLLRTKPYGGVEQNDFLNGVWQLETLYTPEELLDRLHEEENKAGRVREIHWGPRTLDLDILFYEDLIMDEEHLQIPHPDFHNRDFVLLPMTEIAPRFRDPVSGKTMVTICREMNFKTEK